MILFVMILFVNSVVILISFVFVLMKEVQGQKDEKSQSVW